jgi:hypothetical protein
VIGYGKTMHPQKNLRRMDVEWFAVKIEPVGHMPGGEVMGDMADMLMYDDPFDELDSPGPRTWHVCRCCGTEGLFFCKTRGKWRLFYEDKQGRAHLHQCPVNPLEAGK